MGGTIINFHFSRSDCDGEVFVSWWSLERLEKWVVTFRRNNKVVLSYVNGDEKVFNDLFNHFSLYSSILRGFKSVNDRSMRLL